MDGLKILVFPQSLPQLSGAGITGGGHQEYFQGFFPPGEGRVVLDRRVPMM